MRIEPSNRGNQETDSGMSLSLKMGISEKMAVFLAGKMRIHPGFVNVCGWSIGFTYQSTMARLVSSGLSTWHPDQRPDFFLRPREIFFGNTSCYGDSTVTSDVDIHQTWFIYENSPVTRMIDDIRSIPLLGLTKRMSDTSWFPLVTWTLLQTPCGMLIHCFFTTMFICPRTKDLMTPTTNKIQTVLMVQSNILFYANVSSMCFNNCSTDLVMKAQSSTVEEIEITNQHTGVSQLIQSPAFGSNHLAVT